MQHSSRRRLSTVSSKAAANQRVVMTLYRQLLRWCNETEKEIPLLTFVPPVHIQPPQIHPSSLRMVAQKDPKSPLARGTNSTYFPPNAVIEETELTVPIANSEDAKKFFRAIFRMNCYPPATEQDTNNILDDDASMKKEQISLAFEGMRSLNELSTQQLKILKENRDKHWDRADVKFRVGQVVQHNTERWRGVVLGWNRIENKEKDHGTPATSLTQKSYKPTKSEDNVNCVVVLDWGDASLMQKTNRPISSIKNVYQSDLSLIKDQDLLRIRSGQLGEHFKRFDPATRCFVPGEVSAFVFPCDSLNQEWENYKNPSDRAALEMMDGIQKMAEHLRQILLGYTSSPESQKLTILSSLLKRLTRLSEGDVVPNEERFSLYRNSTQILMKHHLELFMNVLVEINDTLWTRRSSKDTNRVVKYNLGEVVQHKKYGFRGVVVAWDVEPAYEVTHWDGLQHIDNPEQYPFYHVIPDPRDVLVAFGGERPWRYVCEENLEACPGNNRSIDVDLEPEWSYDSSSGTYNPPNDLVFRHGGNLKDDGITEKCLQEMKDAIIFLLVSVRESSPIENTDLNSMAELMAIDKFFEILKHAEDSETATVLSDSFKEIWKAHKDCDIRFAFDTGVNYLLKGKTEQALEKFSEVVDKDPGYAEAYNKASTSEFMNGNLDASLAAAQKTLELFPNHFQALNGLGLVYNEKKDLEFAAEAFRKSIELDPWSPVQGRLSVCLDTLERWRKSTFKFKDDATTSNKT
jgi:hemimethylated DNA binding protein